MKSKNIFLIIFFIIIVIISGIFIYRYFSKSNTSTHDNNYSGVKINTTNEISNNTDNNIINNAINSSIKNNNVVESNQIQNKEEEIAMFTTKIYTKEPERQNNISITSSTLNDTVVASKGTFSFCDTVGKATSSKGYQEADVFQDGEVVQALGGGNCQVSTTLYNAVIKVPGLEVTEKHSHSNSVPYISSGMDAAVAYGSYDFKFINNTDFDIKIKVENTDNDIIIRILKIT